VRSYSARVTTYAVKWREPDGQTFIGRLAFGIHALRMEGRQLGADGLAVKRHFAYEELRDLPIRTRGSDRLDGRPALVLERRDGTYLVAGAGMGAPIVQELVERLVDLRLASRAAEDLRLTRSRSVLRPG
jgi:hypothetical protein